METEQVSTNVKGKNYKTIIFSITSLVLLLTNIVTTYLLFNERSTSKNSADKTSLTNTTQITPSPTNTVVTPSATVSVTATPNKYTKFYLSSDKTNYLEYPDSWGISSLEVVEYPFVGPYKEFPNEKKKDILVKYNLELVDKNQNKLLFYQYTTNEPYSDSTGDCQVIKDEDMAFLPKKNGGIGVHRWYDSSRSKYYYLFVTKSNCTPTDGSKGANTYGIQNSAEGYKSPYVSYSGGKDGIKEADEIFVKNFLRESPPTLIMEGKKL